ncbi:MAG: Na/Pi cotransporter family protein [Saprospiraceae bacterium]|nr:Na/Pi cotransporter family protein [Saprospiraceae bacterium]
MEIVNTIGKILVLVGSLGLFLFGMKLMSESLQKVAGNKMRSILATMTSSRLRGVFTGFLVTTGIQSSSATTVMVVSFVNAGLISLVGAVGVIMGANIGTTVTAWLITFLGFGKFSLSALALPIIGIAFPLFFSNNSNRKSWGELLIGFAILFLGLNFLKSNVPDMDSNPEFFHFLANYVNFGYGSIIIFVLLGTIITVAIQSSSATMALTLVLCYNELIPFEMAAAMILGENIGTTITANLAAMVGNVSAKRAARAHLVFNVIGVVWLLIVFFPFLNGIDWITKEINGYSAFTTDSVKPFALSAFHTTFNILNTAFLIGFTTLIVKLVEKMVPQKDEDEEEFRLQYINTALLSTSEISLAQAKNEISIFGKRVNKMFGFVPDLLLEKRSKNYAKLYKKIDHYEQITDNMEIEIAKFLTRISQGKLSELGFRQIRAMLKIVDNLESIGDMCMQMAVNIENKNKQKAWFTQELRDNLDNMFNLVRNALNIMCENLNDEWPEVLIDDARNAENAINSYRDKLREDHFNTQKSKEYSYEAGISYSGLYALCEKIGDHIININEEIVEYKYRVK